MSTAQPAPGTAIEGYTVHGVARTRSGATTHDAVDASGAARQVTVYAAECFPSALVLERSLRELRQLQTLQHPRIVRVYGCGKLPSGATWEAHDPLPSESLAEHLRGGAFAEPDALAIAQQIGEALADAQKVGVIHRNLGADVIFPSPTGVVVAGFAVGAPQGGRSFGALDSIAPEQVEGKVVDQRTLIYNLAALVHFMMHGTPLFTGDPASVLQAHLTTDVADTVVSPLRRGLAKDPRMRPMMLKQFVAELGGGLVGSAARGTAPPSSRGWTMFTSAIESPPADELPTQGAPSAAAPADDVPQPSTRGWTMFMQAEGGGSTPAGSSTDAASEVAAALTPEPDAPVPVAAGGTVATPATAGAPKPSTRGWTMFMQAQDDAAPAPGPTATPVGPTPTLPAAVPPPPAVPPPAAAVVPQPDAPKPSTRGWTMFTSTDSGETATTPPVAASAGSGPTAAAPPAVPTGSTPGPPPAASADGASAIPKPSARGWTMFTKDDDGATAAGTPSSTDTAVTPVPIAPAPAAAPDPAAEGQPPSSRGWTMFMEPASGDAASTTGTPAATPVAELTPAPPGATPMAEPAGAPGGPRRGWTMFMEAPIDDAGQRPFGPETPTPTAPSEEPSSDNRGWTVFGAPAPGIAPVTGPTGTPTGTAPIGPGGVGGSALPPPPQQHGTEASGLGSHDASEAPMASGSVTANPVPEPAPGRTKTVVATGVQAIPGSVGGVTGRTVFPAPGQPGATEMPDTMYFRRGDIPAERPTSRTTAVDVIAPPGRAAAEERVAGSSLPVVMPGRDAPVARSSPRRAAPLVAVGVVAVGLIVAAVIYLT
jgi:hypothetical protein